jgi:hypothetical protein
MPVNDFPIPVQDPTLLRTLEAAKPPDEEVIPEHIASFRATIKRTQILPRGEMNITLAVPFDEKYRAMPITDYVGIQFEVNVNRPIGSPEPTHLPGGGLHA